MLVSIHASWHCPPVLPSGLRFLSGGLVRSDPVGVLMFGQTTAALHIRAGHVVAGLVTGGQRLALTLSLVFLLHPVAAPLAAEPVRNDGAHYTIAVHTSSVKSQREPKAIVEFVKHRVNEINAKGGLLGRRLQGARFR